MPSRDLLALLSAQLRGVGDHIRKLRCQAKSTFRAASVLRSLRMTYAYGIAGLDPAEPGAGMGLSCTRTGFEEFDVRVYSRRVPVPPFVVRDWCSAAGLHLEVGQCLLLEPALMGMILEDAVARVGRELNLLRRRVLVTEGTSVARAAIKEDILDLYERKVRLIAARFAVHRPHSMIPQNGGGGGIHAA